MEDPNHQENLEKLKQGIFVERSISVDSYLSYLQQEIENSNNYEQTTTNSFHKTKSLIKRLKEKWKN